MIIFGFSFLTILALVFSWGRFFQAANNPSLLYLPLENYFFTNKILPGEELFGRPDFFISNFLFKAPLYSKIVYELFAFSFCIFCVLVVLRLMSAHEWFVFNKKIYKEIPVLGGFFTKLSKRIQSKKNIFNLSFKEISILGMAIAFVFFLMIPNDSSDLYGYIARGAQQVFYDMNPYVQTVSQIGHWWDKPLLANINSLWSYNPAPYGPLYMFIYAGLASLSQGNFYLAFFIFKAFNLIVFFLLLITLTKILDDEDLNREFFEKKFSDARQILSYKKIIYSLLALNPFLMAEIMWNGHNDLLMGFLILLGLYLCFKNKFNLALIVLTLSVLSKYLSLVILPFVLIYILSKPFDFKKFPFLGIILSAGAFYASWIHYDPFAAKLTKIGHNLLICHKSLQRTFASLVKFITGLTLPPETNLVFLGIFVLILLFLYYKFWRSENKRLNLLHFSFLALYILIFVISAKFHSWYFLMLLPLGALIHPRLVLFLSLTHVFSLTMLDQMNCANFILMTAIPSYIYFKYLLKQDL